MYIAEAPTKSKIFREVDFWHTILQISQIKKCTLHEPLTSFTLHFYISV